MAKVELVGNTNQTRRVIFLDNKVMRANTIVNEEDLIDNWTTHKPKFHKEENTAARPLKFPGTYWAEALLELLTPLMAVCCH